MTETVTEVVVPDLSNDPLATALMERLNGPIADYKRAVAAMSADPNAVLADLRDNSTDPAVVKIKDQIEALYQKIDEMLRPLLPTQEMTTDEATALRDKSAKEVKDLVKVTRRRTSTSGTSNQVGVSRPRVKVSIDGKEIGTFSLAAKSIGAKVTEMHDAWTKAAGKPAKDITQPVEFEYAVGDKTYKVNVSGKAA